jgi:hypothetical protein
VAREFIGAVDGRVAEHTNASLATALTASADADHVGAGAREEEKGRES